jgi:hypothetical protein
MGLHLTRHLSITSKQLATEHTSRLSTIVPNSQSTFSPRAPIAYSAQHQIVFNSKRSPAINFECVITYMLEVLLLTRKSGNRACGGQCCSLPRSDLHIIHHGPDVRHSHGYQFRCHVIDSRLHFAVAAAGFAVGWEICTEDYD